MAAAERKQLVNEVIEALEEKGFVVVLASELNEFARKKLEARLLSQKSLTPYQIANFELIPNVKSLDTVKNMCKDGRIGPYEHYKDANGKWQVLSTAVKRLRHG